MSCKECDRVQNLAFNKDIKDIPRFRKKALNEVKNERRT